MSILPVARPGRTKVRPRPAEPVGRRRMGSLRAHALDRPSPLRPGVPLLVPGGVGRTGEDPPARRRPADRQSRRRHPLRRPGHHARHRGGAGTARLRHGRLLLQDHPRGRDHVVPDRRRARPIPTTPTGCSTTSSSWPWSSPRAPRRPRRPTPIVTGCAGSEGVGSSRSPCGRAFPSSPSPSSAPRSRCPSCSGSRRWPGCSSCPTSRSPPTSGLRPRPGLRDLLPGQDQDPGARPHLLRRGTRSGRGTPGPR